MREARDQPFLFPALCSDQEFAIQIPATPGQAVSPAAVSKKHLKEFMRLLAKELLGDKANRARKKPCMYITPLRQQIKNLSCSAKECDSYRLLPYSCKESLKY